MHPQRFIRRIRGLDVRGRVNCPKVCWRARVAETPEELRKSGERGSGRRRREKRRVSEGRYDDFERSDDGGVKGLS